MTTKEYKIQIILFLLTGAISAVIEIILMNFLSMPQILPHFFGFENKANAYPLSNVLSTSMGILSNYILSILFVFERGKHSKRKEFILFLVFSLFSMLLSWLAFGFFHRYINHELKLGFMSISDIAICKALAIFFISILNFGIKKKIIFSN